MADYAIEFRTLAAASEWNETVLFDMFYAGLADGIKDEMDARKLPDSFNPLNIRRPMDVQIMSILHPFCTST